MQCGPFGPFSLCHPSDPINTKLIPFLVPSHSHQYPPDSITQLHTRVNLQWPVNLLTCIYLDVQGTCAPTKRENVQTPHWILFHLLQVNMCTYKIIVYFCS